MSGIQFLKTEYNSQQPVSKCQVVAEESTFIFQRQMYIMIRPTSNYHVRKYFKIFFRFTEVL